MLWILENFTQRVKGVARIDPNQKIFQFYLKDKANSVIETTATE
jgi:hypothetical protein